MPSDGGMAYPIFEIVTADQIEPLFGALETETVYIDYRAQLVVEDGELGIDVTGTVLDPAARDDPRPIAALTQEGKVIWVYDKWRRSLAMVVDEGQVIDDPIAYFNGMLEILFATGFKAVPMRELRI